MEASHFISQVLWGGFALAFIFGVVAARTNFCTMGAISDIVNMGHWGRMRMWLLAIAVAVAGTSMLALTGQIDLAKSVPQRANLPWLSLMVGGLSFGVGMTMAGGCANRNLLRLGSGSLRSLVVLAFLGLSAYITLKGLFGQVRAEWLDPVRVDLAALGWPDGSLATALARFTGMDTRTALVGSTAVVCLGLLAFCLKDARFRTNLPQLLGGVVLGLIVVAGWYVTGHLGFGENPDTLEQTYFATNTRTLESLSFVAPVAYTLELLMMWTDKSLHPSFGILSALGVVLGALAYALVTKRFRWEGFASLADLREQLIGAVLMGFGGVTAVGCTVGQGLSGVSTLALSSLLATASIVAGSVVMLKIIAARED